MNQWLISILTVSTQAAGTRGMEQIITIADSTAAGLRPSVFLCAGFLCVPQGLELHRDAQHLCAGLDGTTAPCSFQEWLNVPKGLQEAADFFKNCIKCHEFYRF